jgi:hypothetical protein
MAAPNVIRSGVGFRHCQIFALSTSTGVIAPGAASATAYEGLQISGARTLEIEDPEPQQINHLGDDRIFASDTLPATESLTGTLTVGKINDTVDALITGQTSYTIGEQKFFGIGTNKRGSEVQVAMLAFRQSLDTTPAAQQLRRWEFRLIPATLLIPLAATLNESPEEKTYTVRPQVASKYPWGIAFANGTEGFTEAQALRGIAENKPKIVAWKGNNVLTSFNLPTAFPAVATTKMTVFVYDDSAGTASEDATATLTTTTVDPTATPDTDDIVVLVYEHSQ